MPFDGIVAKCVVSELSEMLDGGRIEKIFQPEADEININIRTRSRSLRLVVSASASYPRIHITGAAKDNPAAPPMFCMVLRKHLTGGRITGVEFHGYERIVTLLIETVNELGDLAVRKLVAEIMGKHSNIILLNGEDRIIDSIKHVDTDISSVREVMPARPYILPPAQDKANPDELDADAFFAAIQASAQGAAPGQGTEPAQTIKPISIEKYLLNGIKGFSPLLCGDVCLKASVDGKTPVDMLKAPELCRLKEALSGTLEDIRLSRFKPCVVFGDESQNEPVDFHCLELSGYRYIKNMKSISDALDLFYTGKDWFERQKQKKADLNKTLSVLTDRCRRKLALQEEKLRETADRDRLKLYGELITANIYNIKPGLKAVSLPNYYSEDGGLVDIPLDENLSPQENAQRYFRQYSKAKSAFINTGRQLEETRQELDYLESVALELENCSTAQEIDEIRQELAEQGYVTDGRGIAGRRTASAKKREKPSAPHSFVSSDGFVILIGKNNRQNDQLTMKNASSSDIWLHTRNIPGSHTIIRKQQREIPDTTLLEAAELCAYFSKAKMSSNVPVDYTTVRNVKKPPGAKPGMVIYENFKTVIVTPSEEIVKRLKKP